MSTIATEVYFYRVVWVQPCRTDRRRPVVNVYVEFKQNRTAGILRQFEKSKSSTGAESGKQTDAVGEKWVLGEINLNLASAAVSAAEVSGSQAAQSFSRC